MILLRPSYEILCPKPFKGKDILERIERAGRTCYKSEEKTTQDSASKFVHSIVRSGHHSVLEHENISVRFICDRGVTHELVRHRLASYSQESTRYCDYSKDKFGNQVTFILPSWIKRTDIMKGVYRIVPPEWNEPFDADEIWFMSMMDSEYHYFGLLDRGWIPQQARSVLPNSLKTEIVMTANVREWRHVLDLRTSPAAHPQIREIMFPLLKFLNDELPEVYGDIYEKRLPKKT